MAEWEDKRTELAQLSCTIYGISVDTIEQAQEVLRGGITFPVIYGCTKAHGDAIGAWWGHRDPHGQHIQPTEFLLGRGGVILGSMYASGPIGRMRPEETIALINAREQRHR